MNSSPNETQFVIKRCIKCGKERKFLRGSRRDIWSICGECWKWKVPET